jgi:hypothetical protein
VSRPTSSAPRCLKDVSEERLFAHRRDLLTRLDLVFMDTTSLYFEGAAGQTLGEHGYSNVALAAIRLYRARFERQPREHDDAVIALLTVERDVLVAQPLETLARESVVRALGLLQAEDVGADGLDEPGDEIDAQAHLSVPGRPEIFAVGDTAAVTDRQGRPVPGIAPAAKQMGGYVGEVIAARVQGRPPPPPFAYHHLGDLATIGRNPPW